MPDANKEKNVDNKRVKSIDNMYPRIQSYPSRDFFESFIYYMRLEFIGDTVTPYTEFISDVVWLWAWLYYIPNHYMDIKMWIGYYLSRRKVKENGV